MPDFDPEGEAVNIEMIPPPKKKKKKLFGVIPLSQG